MINNFKNLHDQINKQISESSYSAPTNVNPVFRNTSISKTSNINSKPSFTTSSSYQWQLRESVSNIFVSPAILDNTSFVIYGTSIKSSTKDSSNGNLTLTNLNKNKIYALSAYIERATTSASIAMNLTFVGSVNVILNGQSIYKNGNNSNNSFSLSLGVGKNLLEIFIWTGNSTALNTGGNLANFADNWTIPVYGEPSPPLNLNVRRDTNEISSNTYINIIKWDLNQDGNSHGYKLYRQGPRSAVLSEPSGTYINPTTSGNMIPGETYYYAVSAYDENGESLPYFYTTSVTTQDQDPPLSLSSYKSETSGAFQTGYYYYGATYWGDNNKETTISAIAFIDGYSLPSGVSIQLQWSYNTGILGSVYNFAPSGIKLYKSSSGVFAGNSLLAIITGLEINTFLDTGYSSTIGAPPATSQLFSGVGVNITWNAPSVGTPDGYYIYRSQTSNFLQNTLITTTTNTNLFDSGYVATTGVPTIYKNIADLFHPTNRYDDVGVKRGQTYDYQISAYSSSLVESTRSSGISILVGDNIPPIPPTGILVNVSDAYAGLSWQNGNEDDLIGTRIYFSQSELGTYNLVADVQNTTVYSKYIGYNSTGYFKLANYDWSENQSTYSSGASGVTSNQPIAVVPPSYSWSTSYSKNPTTTGSLLITIASPTTIIGTPTIQVKQNGQANYSLVTPVAGTSPIYSGYYTVVGNFDGVASVVISGNAADSTAIFSSSTFVVDTVAPVGCFINFGF